MHGKVVCSECRGEDSGGSNEIVLCDQCDAGVCSHADGPKIWFMRCNLHFEIWHTRRNDAPSFQDWLMVA